MLTVCIETPNNTSLFKLILVCNLVCSLLPASYRQANEIKEIRQHRDPIMRVEDRALEGNLATEQELKVWKLC